jgi:hypothetical protein
MKLSFESNLIFFFIFLLSFLTACSQSKDTPSNDQPKSPDTFKYELVAKEKFKENYVMQYSPAKSYVLCLKKDSYSKEKNNISSYFIYDLNKDGIVYEETIGKGSVEWLNDNQLQVSVIPGIVKGDEKQVNNKLNYIYDLGIKRKLFNTNDKGK